MIQVVTIDAIRAGDVLQIHHRAQRHHLPAGVSRLELFDILRPRAKWRVRLRHDTIGSAEIVEVVDVQAAEINLQSLKRIGDGDVLLLGLDAIKVGVELRDIRAKAREQRLQFSVLAALGDEIVNDGLQLLRRVRAGSILHLHLEPARAADAANWRRWEHQGKSILDLAELAGQLARDRLPLKLGLAFAISASK